MERKSIIDRETVQRIIDTANIVEVVQDFVSLRRRGANYIGLCPFHNERTPSFSVSPAKGICKCFSCGKGGSPVNFIMEHEQMTYWEALRYLARKYHIEVKEKELTEEERRAQSERQLLLSVNEMAMKHFEDRMANTDEGRDVGLSYFRHRGISDAAIARFHLGFSLEKRDDLAQAALKAGYSKESLVKTGLCFATENGELRDRFRGRVIYPVFTISGKVVAFGGRILTNDKKLAKYVNSPESEIYSKRRELYGLYQAKQSIVRKNRCILVEGYMDVISMSQRGIENVVASSGTSLTDDQVRLIHRFTPNVTVIYDSDPAGIKASLRGIDLLLAEGLDIKVCLLPDGDDPDSFAQAHTTEEIESYLAAHEVDFIRFKTDILLKDAGNDPIAVARVVADIVRSISVIPDEITRNVYIGECSRRFNMDDELLTRQVALARTKRLEQLADEKRREDARRSLGNLGAVAPQKSEGTSQPTAGVSQSALPGGEQPGAGTTAPAQAEGHQESAGQQPGAPAAEAPIDEANYAVYLGKSGSSHRAKIVEPQERSLLRLVLRYGMLDLGEDYGTSETGQLLKVIDYVREDLEEDGLSFENAEYEKIYRLALEYRDEHWDEDFAAYTVQAQAEREEAMRAGLDEIRQQAKNLDEIRQREVLLKERVEEDYRRKLVLFARSFFSRELLSHPDDMVRRVSTELCVDRYQLSKIYFKNNTKVVTDVDRLDELVPRALLELKYDIARCHFNELSQKIKDLQNRSAASAGDPSLSAGAGSPSGAGDTDTSAGKDAAMDEDARMEEILNLMKEQTHWQNFCKKLATSIGERVYEPLR